MGNFLKTYKKSHTHPFNHTTHAVGIPMIVISLVLFFFNWKVALILFTLGWTLQFLGHWVEGKPPAFFKNPTYLIIGPIWWVKKILLRDESGNDK